MVEVRCGESVRSEVAKAALERRAASGDFVIALSGGSAVDAAVSPELFGSAYGQRWTVLLCDERCVPESSADSNRGAIVAKAGPLLAGHSFPAAYYGSEEPSVAAAAYGVALDGLQLDVAVLGIGPDGHTASLFPGHAWDTADGALVMAVYDSPKPPARRVTLSRAALMRFRRLIFVATGAQKAPIVSQCLAADTNLPAGVLLREHPDAVLVVDRPLFDALS